MKNKKNIKITILIILTILLTNKTFGSGFLDFNKDSVRGTLTILLIISIKNMIIPYIVKKKKNIKKETLIKICKINSILITIIDEIILITIMINNKIDEVQYTETIYIYDLAKDLIIPTIIIGIIYYFINYTLYNDEKTTKNKIKNKTDDLKMEEK